MPRYAGQLTFMIARLRNAFDEWTKKITLYFFVYFHSSSLFPELYKEHLLFSQEILCNILQSP